MDRSSFPSSSSPLHSAFLVLPVSGAAHAGYQLARDRYSYLSGMGFVVLVGAAMVWVIRAGARGRLRPWLEGLLLLDQDRLAEAETAFRAAVTRLPESAGPRNNLSAVLVRLGRYDEAAAQFRDATRLAPHFIGGVLNLGLLYVIQGKYAEAIPVLRHVLAQRPDRPDAQAALSTALVKRADELRREGRPGEADSLVRESATLARDRSATEALPKVLSGLR